MKKDFLLTSETARVLYDCVKDLPIIDYHNHLSLVDIKENKRFLDVYELWIEPDPYKHRAMRMCGISEYYITGKASAFEKFAKWCEVFPRLVGNPLYHWSMMELSEIFGIEEIPSEENASALYETCNDFLKNNLISAESLLSHFGVELACPCVSLTDDVSYLEENERIAPSLRGDDILLCNEEFSRKLGTLTSLFLEEEKGFEKAVQKRLEHLEKCGLVFTDHALDNGFHFEKKPAKGSFSHRLLFLGSEYARRGLVMQLHMGAQRYTSSKLRTAAGAAGGFAAIGNSVDVDSLTSFLDALDQKEHGLPKTLLFPLNPADNALCSVLSGSYSQDGTAGLITQGPAWWWCDHKLGIVDMLENAASFGVLSNFIGMTTDSRSFLSFVRHDYFRRILCDWVGKKVESGEWIGTEKTWCDLVYKLCYGNAKNTVKNRKGDAL